tara:strand:+ start:5114 stop:5626 length:513 start_codon:yes stop_codon:yes gene_type:complete
MARIDYSIGLSAIQSTTFEGNTIEAIESDIGRGFSGAKSDSTWGGTVNWSSNNAGHKQSRSSSNTISTVAGTDGLWIKHTGFKYDSGLTTTAETTTKVIVSRTVTHTEFNTGSPTDSDGAVTLNGGSVNVQIAKLESGQAIFLPTPGAATWVLTDDSGGQAVAVEYAELR